MVQCCVCGFKHSAGVLGQIPCRHREQLYQNPPFVGVGSDRQKKNLILFLLSFLLLSLLFSFLHSNADSIFKVRFTVYKNTEEERTGLIITQLGKALAHKLFKYVCSHFPELQSQRKGNNAKAEDHLALCTFRGDRKLGHAQSDTPLLLSTRHTFNVSYINMTDTKNTS